MSNSKKILIVEDDEDFRSLYSLYLQSESHTVELAEHGQDALEKLGSGFEPDLIILDLIMPVMDGEAFYGALRAESKWRDIPVMVASVNERLPDSMKSEGRVWGVLKKPFEMQQLIDKVNEV